MAIEKARFCDLEEILLLQKWAFQSEADLFNDYSITPLTQSIASIEEDFKNHLYLKAEHNGKIIGSVRAYEKENVCHIGRLIVHPDHQNKGIGKSLIYHIEELFGVVRCIPCSVRKELLRICICTTNLDTVLSVKKSSRRI